MTLIYKISPGKDWQQAEARGRFSGAPVDLADGFIHFSAADQVRETAAKHFAEAEGLILAAVDAAPLGDDLKWEVSRGGAEFPHLYRALRLEDVPWHEDLPLVDGAHVFPDRMS